MASEDQMDIGSSHPNQTGPFKFKYPPDFGRLNVEAQRRAPDQIEPPYLSWHFSCWQPRSTPGHEQNPYATNSDRERWRAKINEFLSFILGDEQNYVEFAEGAQDRLNVARSPRNIMGHISRGFEWLRSRKKPVTADTQDGQDKQLAPFVVRDYQTFYGVGPHKCLSLRLEYHSEYVSFTFFLPIPRPSWDSTSSTAVGIDKFDIFTSEAFGWTEGGHTDPEKRSFEKSLKALVEDVFDKLKAEGSKKEEASKQWDRLYSDAWDLAFKWLEKEHGEPDTQLGPPGEVFANYRGIFLPRIWLAAAGGAGELDKHIEYWCGRDIENPIDAIGSGHTSVRLDASQSNSNTRDFISGKESKANRGERFVSTDLTNLPHVPDDPDIVTHPTELAPPNRRDVGTG